MSRTQFAVDNYPHLAPSTHITPASKHLPSTNLSTDSAQVAALMGEVDRWLVILQKGIRDLEERHKEHLGSGSGVDGLTLSGSRSSDVIIS
jgi:hypothetical protein